MKYFCLHQKQKKTENVFSFMILHIKTVRIGMRAKINTSKTINRINKNQNIRFYQTNF